MSNPLKCRLCLLLLMAFAVVGNTQPLAHSGVLDARDFDFRNDRLSLSGTWIIYDSLLLTPEQLSTKRGQATDFPQTWNDLHGSGQGTATYSLRVLVQPGLDLAIELPQIYSSYKMWVNNTLIAENGVPGPTREETKPQWMPHTISFPNNEDTLRITLQIANFTHHKGGCKDPIYMGEASGMMAKQQLSTVSKLIECGVLFVMAVIFLIIYLQQGRKKVIAYFSLLCLTWSMRSVFSNDYTFISFFPDFNWTAMIRIEYITLYLTMMWAILYLGRIFTNEGSPIIKYLLATINGGFVAYTMFATPAQFTMLLPAYLITSGIVLLYGAGVVLVALINERIGATFLTISVVMGLVIFSYDIFTYEGFFTYNSVLFSAAYIVIFLSMGVALLLKLDIIKSGKKPTTMLTYKDLYGEQ